MRRKDVVIGVVLTAALAVVVVLSVFASRVEVKRANAAKIERAARLASLPPLEFRGLTPGAPSEEMRRVFLHLKKGAKATPEMLLQGTGEFIQRTCEKTEDRRFECHEYAAPTSIDLFFVDEGFAGAWYVIPHDGFAEVRDALIEKYGPPDDRFSNKYQGEVLVWDHGSTALRLNERYGRDDLSEVEITAPRLLDIYFSRSPKKPKPEI